MRSNVTNHKKDSTHLLFYWRDNKPFFNHESLSFMDEGAKL